MNKLSLLMEFATSSELESYHHHWSAVNSMTVIAVLTDKR